MISENICTKPWAASLDWDSYTKYLVHVEMFSIGIPEALGGGGGGMRWFLVLNYHLGMNLSRYEYKIIL